MFLALELSEQYDCILAHGIIRWIAFLEAWDQPPLACVASKLL